MLNNGKESEQGLHENTAQVLVSSLLVHFNETPGSNGFIQMQIGQEKVVTSLIDIIAAEILWVEKSRIPVFSG